MIIFSLLDPQPTALSSSSGSNNEMGIFCSPEFAGGEQFEAIAYGRIDLQGGRLSIPECNVSLTVPQGAIPQENINQQFFVAVTTSAPGDPVLSDKQVRKRSSFTEVFNFKIF